MVNSQFSVSTISSSCDKITQILHTTATKTTLHGLGGNDTLTGGTTDDILVGGAGNDTRVSTVMVNSQFGVSTISSSCDKITQMRSSAISYQ
jgi:Ca2+-binding RTX toxin-like protein